MRPEPVHRLVHCELAWLPPGRLARDVLVEIDAATIRSVSEQAPAPPDASRLRGFVMPGMANAHSHAFHRALRGRTQATRGSFWTWRSAMYDVAARLDPDTYLALARATYAEMSLAGITSVGEFHYLHHGADGTPYTDPNEMAHALVAAAHDAGVRVALLDACYLTGGIDAPLEGVQRRFGDGDAQRWADRAGALAATYDGRDDVVAGAAVHSVRAVPADQIVTVAQWAADGGRPLHLHLSEQPAENAVCREAYDCSPTELLHERGALGDRTTAVHATHVTDLDIGLLSSTRTSVCLCPTTERDLADGIPPGELLGSRVGLSLGSDSHAVIDLLEEARAVELDNRLSTGERGHLLGTDLLAATLHGHPTLGFPTAGRIEAGARADLVAVSLTSPRTSGGGDDHALDRVVFGATASDVTDVVSDGRHVVVEGRHALGDVGLLLRNAIADLG